jgi:hypothetical protein
MSGTALWASDGSLTSRYREVAARLIGAALTDEDGWNKLVYLCDRIGSRASGSKALEQAIEWSAATMKQDGLENVQKLPVQVPHWERGQESATMLEPARRSLPMLGLGYSIGTPPGGITAEVVPVTSFEELEKLGRERVEGKIVLYNQPWQGYGRTVVIRGAGASRAARLGAVGMLLRSLTPVSLQSPHTGVMRYAPDAPKIPAAAISVEAAAMLHRLYDAGNRVVVNLTMEARMLPDAESANVIGEIRGREKPEEIVVLGGHLDSWDVGQGAQDDGAGCIATLQAVALMKKLGLRPRRTVRVVFWTNEETEGKGAAAYRAWVGDKIRDHVAAIEMDGGAEKPVGYGLGLTGANDATYERALAKVREIGRLLEGIGAGEVFRGGGGADIGPLMRDGVPGFAHRTVGLRYMEWHHSHADTVDKIDKQEFRQNIAALAVLAYVLADMPERVVG